MWDIVLAAALTQLELGGHLPTGTARRVLSGELVFTLPQEQQA